MTLEQFAKLVRDHDLTYAFSDDHSVWERGQRERDVIVAAAKDLPREEVVRIWNAEVDRKLSDGTGFYWK
jgi:hypothetical protein